MDLTARSPDHAADAVEDADDDDVPTTACQCLPPARLLVVPGLGDSGPDHWQTWLQSLHRHAVRVTQQRWNEPDLERWSACIGSTVERAGSGPFIAVAHSFGVLALVHHLANTPASPIAAALLVAPANPDRFAGSGQLPRSTLPVLSAMVLSQTDPWLPSVIGWQWARRWGCHIVGLGDAGHVNAAAGFGRFPFARRWVIAMEQHVVRRRRQQSDPHSASAYASAH